MATLDDKAVAIYRDLIEQGLARSQAQAHIHIVFGVRLSETFCVLIERGFPHGIVRAA